MKHPIEFYFEYHPPTTQKRKDQHSLVNKASLDYAKVILANVENEEAQALIINAIQQARMLANQYITVEEITKENRFLETYKPGTRLIGE